jgi:hypothetical protein
MTPSGRGGDTRLLLIVKDMKRMKDMKGGHQARSA